MSLHLGQNKYIKIPTTSRTWRYFWFILLKAQIFSWEGKRTHSQNQKKIQVGYTSYEDSNLKQMQSWKAYGAYCLC